MPPRPSSPRISYLPALVAVTIFVFLQGTDAKRLTVHVLADSCRGQCPSELGFRSCHEGRLRLEMGKGGAVKVCRGRGERRRIFRVWRWSRGRFRGLLGARWL